MNVIEEMMSEGFRIYIVDGSILSLIIAASILVLIYLSMRKAIRASRKLVGRRWPNSRFAYFDVKERLISIETKIARLSTVDEELEVRISELEETNTESYREINSRLETIERWDVGTHFALLETQLAAVPVQISKALESVRLKEDELLAHIDEAKAQNAKQIQDSENSTVKRIETLLIDMLFSKDGKPNVDSN